MTLVEELVAVPGVPAQAMRALLTPARAREWMAWDVRLTPRQGGATLGTGDRFTIELFGGLEFDYLIEATSDREIVLSFDGPWRGHERWSFVADGAETLVRRSYAVEGGSVLAALAWGTVGRAVVSAHLRHELSRFREAVAREPGPRGEIAAASLREDVPVREVSGDAGRRPPFPVDDG